MKVRVEIEGDGHHGDSRYLHIKFLPRVGEFLETDLCGTCEVVQIVHTPESKEQDAILVLRKLS